MRQLVGFAFVMAFPVTAQAASLCTFTTECFENEACQPTQFELEFRAGTGGPNELEIVTEAETVGVAVGGSGEVAHLAGMNADGFHVLTVMRETGAARYTRHIGDGPRSVTYLGSCELGG